MRKKNFGTDGWRGIIAEDFTVENLRRVVQAICGYVKHKGDTSCIVIGYDNRFMSEYYARAAAEVVWGSGIKALISTGAVTTPMVSHAVMPNSSYGSSSGGIMITASHNPYCYNGVKFKAPYGGSASPAMTTEIESFIDRTIPVCVPYERACKEGGVVATELARPYLAGLLKMINVDVVRGLAPTVAFDCMHGSAGGSVEAILGSFGLKTNILRGNRDPYFGGISPEPMEENLAGLAREVRESGLDIGLATDGDADRLGVVDEEGTFVTPHEVLALLTIHMRKNRGLGGAVVKTVTTGALIDRVAKDLGLPVIETKVGFKHICELMLKEDVLIGGEENGGIGFKGNIPERDGILAGLMLLEMMAVEGKGIRELKLDMDKRYGRLYYKRHDARMENGSLKRVSSSLKDVAGATYKDLGVKSTNTLDGVKLFFKDGSWVLFRPSGTEDVLRIYAEAEALDRAQMLIDRGREALDG